MESLSQWLDARSRLDDAASKFFDACLALQTEAAQSHSLRINDEARETLIDQIRSHVDVVPSVTKRMIHSQAVLNSLLNISTSQVPISRLPPETLSQIFDLCLPGSPCRQGPYSLEASHCISLVSVRWHEIAKATPSLWSHLDIHLERSRDRFEQESIFSRINLWLNRTRGASIHLHVGENFRQGTPEKYAFISTLVAVLRPYAPFLRSLTVCGSQNSDLACSLLELFAVHCAPGTLKMLSLGRIGATRHQAGISWSVCSFKGLTVLEIVAIRGLCTPKSDVFIGVLSECPALHTIRLEAMEISLNQLWYLPTAHAYLPSLRLLDLSDVGGDGFPLLFQAMVPGTLELDVRLNISAYRYHQIYLSPSVKSFLKRSNVVSLALGRTTEDVSRLLAMLSCVPHLRALLLDVSNPNSISQGISDLLKPESKLAILLPHLQSIYLSNGRIEDTMTISLKDLVIECSLRNLVFDSCIFWTPANTSSVESSAESDDDSTLSNYSDVRIESNHIGVWTEGNHSSLWSKKIPEEFREWVYERVCNITIKDDSGFWGDDRKKVYQGVDPFIRMLVELD